MNESKKRRKEARAAQFSGHQPDMQYRPDSNAAAQQRSGREWDSEQGKKADVREVESSKKERPGTATFPGEELPTGDKTRAGEVPRGNTPGRVWDGGRKPMSNEGLGDVGDSVVDESGTRKDRPQKG